MLRASEDGKPQKSSRIFPEIIVTARGSRPEVTPIVGDATPPGGSDDVTSTVMFAGVALTC